MQIQIQIVSAETCSLGKDYSRVIINEKGNTMYELQVEGMSCGGCVRGVTRSVQALDAGAKVAVDLDTGKVSIEATAGLDAIVAAISEAGYPVTASSQK